MKHKFLMLIVCLLGAGFLTVSAQKVPEAVKKSFTESFGNATNVKWKKDGGNYFVRYKLAGTDHRAIYNFMGSMLSSGKELKKNELPEAISKAVARDFPGYKVKFADELSTGNVTTYKVELKGKPYSQAWYKADGTLIEKHK